MTISPIVLRDEFLSYLKSKGKSKNTLVAYLSDVSQFIAFLSKKGKFSLDEVNTLDILDFKTLLHTERYSEASIARKINSLNTFFKFLIKKGYYTELNPVKRVSLPKVNLQAPRFLTKKEYTNLRLVSSKNAKVSVMIELLLQTGMKISELAELKMEDLDLKKSLIKVGSGKRTRLVPLNNTVKAALVRYLKERPLIKNKYLLLSKNGKPYDVRGIRANINAYLKKAGITDATVNDFRATFIVEQLKSGTPITYIAYIVGHKRISSTERYLKYIEEDLREKQLKQKIGEI